MEDEINKMKGEIKAEFDAFCGELEIVLPGERDAEYQEILQRCDDRAWKRLQTLNCPQATPNRHP